MATDLSEHQTLHLPASPRVQTMTLVSLAKRAKKNCEGNYFKVGCIITVLWIHAEHQKWKEAENRGGSKQMKALLRSGWLQQPLHEVQRQLLFLKTKPALETLLWELLRDSTWAGKPPAACQRSKPCRTAAPQGNDKSHQRSRKQS